MKTSNRDNQVYVIEYQFDGGMAEYVYYKTSREQNEALENLLDGVVKRFKLGGDENIPLYVKQDFPVPFFIRETGRVTSKVFDIRKLVSITCSENYVTSERYKEIFGSGIL